MDDNKRDASAAFPIAEDLQLITVADIAAMLKVNPKAAYSLCHRAGFPSPIRFGTQRLRWRLSDVRAWMDRGGTPTISKQAGADS